MGYAQDPRIRQLGCCHGYAAVASDGPLGMVETPLFPPDTDVPDYLVVRIGAADAPRFPVIAAAAVTSVDTRTREVRIDGTVAELERMPEHLPLAP